MGVSVLRRYRDYWGNQIDVEFIPFFLGGIMVGAENRPPAAVPGGLPLALSTVNIILAKAIFVQKDVQRSSKLMGLAPLRQPTIFPIQSYKVSIPTLSPDLPKQMRIICALKDAEVRGEVPKDISLDVAERLWLALWREDKNTSEEAVMQAELDPILPGGWKKWKHVFPFLLAPAIIELC